jgi:hypothetical protein
MSRLYNFYISKENKMLATLFTLTRTKWAVFSFLLYILLLGLYLGSTKPAYAGPSKLGCWSVYYLGRDNTGDYKYRVYFRCRGPIKRKIDWVNAYDTGCITFKRDSSYWTSRRRNRQFSYLKPKVRGVIACN